MKSLFGIEGIIPATPSDLYGCQLQDDRLRRRSRAFSVSSRSRYLRSLRRRPRGRNRMPDDGREAQDHPHRARRDQGPHSRPRRHHRRIRPGPQSNRATFKRITASTAFWSALRRSWLGMRARRTKCFSHIFAPSIRKSACLSSFMAAPDRARAARAASCRRPLPRWPRPARIWPPGKFPSRASPKEKIRSRRA